MAVSGSLTAVAIVEIDGSKVTEAVRDSMVSVVVENSMWLPDRASVVFADPDGTVAEAAHVSIGAKLEVKVEVTSGRPDELFTGEVTAIELDHGPLGSRTVVRALDRSHRMLHGTSTKAWIQETASDIASRLANSAGIHKTSVTPTSYVYPQVAQANMSDWQFLQRLASECGYLAYVTNGTFHFEPPPDAASGPQPGNLTSASGLQLVMGVNLVRLRATVRSTEQVPGVKVRGWDPSTKQAVTAEGTPSAKEVSAGSATAPTKLASSTGAGPFVAVNRPYGHHDAASGRAKAIAEGLAGSAVDIEGECLGNPHLLPGVAFSLGMVGDTLQGRYVASATRHAVDHNGYRTGFTVSGHRDASLLAEASGATFPHAPPMPGVVPAVVTDVKDAEGLARVKLKFPWLDDSYTSDWARTVHAGASNGFGSLVMPEVNDEVLVAFEQGDVNQPYVIGGLYNGQDKPQPTGELVDQGSGRVTQRRLRSRLKHEVLFLDGPQKSGITIQTGDGNEYVKIDAQETTITVHSSGKVVIEGADIQIKATGDLTLQAQGKLEASATGEMSLAAQGALKMSAQAEAQLSSTGITSVRGSMVQIN